MSLHVEYSGSGLIFVSIIHKYNTCLVFVNTVYHFLCEVGPQEIQLCLGSCNMPDCCKLSYLVTFSGKITLTAW